MGCERTLHDHVHGVLEPTTLTCKVWHATRPLCPPSGTVHLPSNNLPDSLPVHTVANATKLDPPFVLPHATRSPNGVGTGVEHPH